MSKSRTLRFEKFEPRVMLAGDGLLGTYFNNANLTAQVQQRVDPIVQFPAGFIGSNPDMGNAPPGTAVQADDNWSMRWTGHVYIETGGEWTFHTDSDDGVRLTINGQQIIDNWSTHPLTRDSGTLSLESGWIPIQLDYFQSGTLSTANRAAIQLSYEGPGQSEIVVPQSNLSSQLLSSQDIGAVAFAGSATLDHQTGIYSIDASGADIQGTADAFHYAFVPVTGDGEIVAQVVSVEETSIFAKGGVMFRETLDAGSRNAFMQVKANRGTEFQYRTTPNGGTSISLTDGPRPPYWVRLTRVGDTFAGYRSADGVTWELEATANVPMNDSLFVGLAVTSHNNSAVATATFSNVRISSEVTPQDPVEPGGTGVSGFISLLNNNTFDPLTDDGQDPQGFFNDNDEFYTFRGERFDINAQNPASPGHDEDEGKLATDDDVVFRLTPDGVLHILGIPDNGQQEEFGYISTEDNYRNYHLSLEYQWGVEKFHPRNTAKRDSGLLYHAVGPDVVWTTNVETQIQEGDTGDFFFLGEAVAEGSTQGTVTLANGKYQPGGVPTVTGGGATKSQTVDSLTDWNRVEVIVEQDEVTVVVNGVVVNRATDLRRPDGSMLIPLTEGKIALQAEGAEVFYRNIQIKPVHAVGGWHDYKLLLFQETAGFDHRGPGTIQAAEAAILALSQANRFTVDIANDSSGVFTDASLSQYDAVVWNSTSGDVLNPTEQAAFERYIQAGGGFIGLHAAADTEYSWPWYGDLVGAYFANHPAQQLATLRRDPEAALHAGGAGLHHPAVDSLPQEWQRVDEWYNFQSNPRNDVNVLLTLDESTYNEGNDPDGSSDHPIAWWHDYDGGRSFYTGLGHRPETYSEPLFLTHLLGGIEYAAGVSRVAPEDAIVLFDGSNTNAFEKVSDGSPIGWQIDPEGNLAIVPGTGNIRTKQGFTDYRLHLEFKNPATSPNTSEQQRGNSGLYLHSSYELQILDSYGDPNYDAQHVGSIYNVKAGDVNAALPAETWQVYDVQFTSPRFNANGVKVSNARITAYLNGVLIHDDVEVAAPTNGGQPEQAGPQPFFLQDHDPKGLLKFRNIWLVPQPARAGDVNNDGSVDAADLGHWESNYGSGNVSDADADGDSDGNDFLIWQREFSLSSASIPASQAPLSSVEEEPTGVLVATREASVISLPTGLEREVASLGDRAWEEFELTRTESHSTRPQNDSASPLRNVDPTATVVINAKSAANEDETRAAAFEDYYDLQNLELDWHSFR